MPILANNTPKPHQSLLELCQHVMNDTFGNAYYSLRMLAGCFIFAVFYGLAVLGLGVVLQTHFALPIAAVFVAIPFAFAHWFVLFSGIVFTVIGLGMGVFMGLVCYAQSMMLKAVSVVGCLGALVLISSMIFLLNSMDMNAVVVAGSLIVFIFCLLAFVMKQNLPRSWRFLGLYTVLGVIVLMLFVFFPTNGTELIDRDAQSVVLFFVVVPTLIGSAVFLTTAAIRFGLRYSLLGGTVFALVGALCVFVLLCPVLVFINQATGISELRFYNAQTQPTAAHSYNNNGWVFALVFAVFIPSIVYIGLLSLRGCLRLWALYGAHYCRALIGAHWLWCGRCALGGAFALCLVYPVVIVLWFITGIGWTLWSKIFFAIYGFVGVL